MTRAALFQHFIALAACTAVYAISFEAIFLVSEHLQAHLAPQLVYGSVLFFPHGVRVIAAYLFGPSSILYLLPISCAYADFGVGIGGAVTGLTLAVGSLAACVLAFEGLSRGRLIERDYLSRAIDWQSLVLAGCFGAFINAALHYTLSVTDQAGSAAIFIGDLLGLCVVLAVALLLFRSYRLYRR